MSEKIRISKVKQSLEGYRLTISALEKPILVPAQLFHEYRLKEGIVITESQLAQLTAEAEIAGCEASARRSLAMREHSVGELTGKLKQKKYGPRAIELALAKLQASGFLDDARLADQLARRTLKQKPCGRAFLMAFLQRKKIDRALAEKTVGNLLAGSDDTATALDALRQKRIDLTKIEVEAARRKAYSFLSRRGLSYAAAKAAFEQWTKEQTEDSQDQDF